MNIRPNLNVSPEVMILKHHEEQARKPSQAQSGGPEQSLAMGMRQG